jgi:putative transposase
VTCAIQAKDLYRPMEAVETLPDGAGDPGLESLLTDTEGVKHDPRKAWHEARQRLAHEMRDMSRKFRMREDQWKEGWIEWIAQGVKPKVSLREVPYSKRLQEQIRRVAKLHARVFNIRDNDHKKLAARIEKTFRLFGIEEHGLMFMLRNRRQAKLAQDRAIGRMRQLVQSKLGPRYYEVPNRGPDGRGNSQVCVCGADVPKELGDREHDCPVCGLKAERDFVAANVGMQHTLGYVSEQMKQLQEAAGQAATGRGGGEVAAGASCGGESRCSPAVALESPVKRQPLAEPEVRNTAGGEPTARGKKGGISRGGATRRSRSRRAPKPGQCGPQGRRGRPGTDQEAHPL